MSLYRLNKSSKYSFKLMEVHRKMLLSVIARCPQGESWLYYLSLTTPSNKTFEKYLQVYLGYMDRLIGIGADS